MAGEALPVFRFKSGLGFAAATTADTSTSWSVTEVRSAE